jgi:outer membrane lipopolysaccharide assembly protein LptE/RlpB
MVGCCLLLPLACGYNFAGGGALPGGVQTVFVELFVNRTNEIGVENTFTNDLVNEILLNRNKRALATRDQAESILKCTIVSLASNTIAQTSTGRATERRLVVVVDAELVDRQGRVIWSAGKIRSYEPYDVGADETETELNRSVALRELSQRLAENIYNRMTEDF